MVGKTVALNSVRSIRSGPFWFLAQALRAESPRTATGARTLNRMLALVALAALQQTNTSPDPGNVRLIFDDVDRFYRMLERTPDDQLKEAIARDYYTPGTKALAFFRLTKIRLADQMVQYVRANRSSLMQAKERVMRLKEIEPRVKAVFYAFKYLYPDAVFPPIYFVIGRESSGGTICQEGLILGAEMSINDPATVDGIIAHELIHFNQKMGSSTLLSATIAEGMADLLGEMASGKNTNEHLIAYAKAHEKEIWQQWKHDVANGNKIKDWIGSYRQTEPRPGDLGYVVGYKICRAFVERSKDKLSAIRKLLTTTDAAKIVEESGYNPQ